MHKTGQTAWATSWCVVLTCNFSLRAPISIPCRLVPRFFSDFLAQRWFQLDSLPTFTRLCYCFLAFQVALDYLWPLDDASDSRRVPSGLCFVISLLSPPQGESCAFYWIVCSFSKLYLPLPQFWCRNFEFSIL